MEKKAQAVITDFNESNRKQLALLYAEVRKETFTWLPPERFNLADFDADTLGERILVAWNGNKIAGFISAWLPDNFIHHLYIHPDHRNKGIGTQLLNQLITELNYPITLKCLTYNTMATSFYKNKGWLARFEAASAEGQYILFELPSL